MADSRSPIYQFDMAGLIHGFETPKKGPIWRQVSIPYKQYKERQIKPYKPLDKPCMAFYNISNNKLIIGEQKTLLFFRCSGFNAWQLFFVLWQQIKIIGIIFYKMQKLQ